MAVGGEALGRYPFKHMQAIINLLVRAGDQGAGISAIASGIHACHPDTAEVLAMVSHLTTRGRIVPGRDGSFRLDGPGTAPRAPAGFRGAFVAEAVRILDALERGPASVTSIASSTSLNTNVVDTYLRFLEALTRQGRVDRHPGDVVYRLVPWDG